MLNAPISTITMAAIWKWKKTTTTTKRYLWNWTWPLFCHLKHQIKKWKQSPEYLLCYWKDKSLEAAPSAAIYPSAYNRFFPSENPFLNQNNLLSFSVKIIIKSVQWGKKVSHTQSSGQNLKYQENTAFNHDCWTEHFLVLKNANPDIRTVGVFSFPFFPFFVIR